MRDRVPPLGQQRGSPAIGLDGLAEVRPGALSFAAWWRFMRNCQAAPDQRKTTQLSCDAIPRVESQIAAEAGVVLKTVRAFGSCSSASGGWTPEQWEQWFADAICAQLLNDTVGIR
jgi:poly(3-hydroxybutyrate) depolymerase